MSNAEISKILNISEGTIRQRIARKTDNKEWKDWRENSMGQIDVTDAWLYKYMSIVDEAIINEIEKNVDYDYAFSDEFNRKMERTIRKEKFIPFWNSVSKFGKSVAIFALVIVTSLFAVTMSVEAYRIQFF